MSAPIRTSAVHFLNTAPIVHGLTSSTRFQLTSCAPAECARQLLEGEADLGLIPVAAYATHGLYEAVPGIAIAARGPVGSVFVVSQVPIDQVEALALDGSSKTSVVLARLWLRHRLQREPRLFQTPAADVLGLVEGTTAAVVIGDQARGLGERFAYVYDLAEEWQSWTGLPFVFAVWAARPGVIDSAAADELQLSLAKGLAARREIALQYAMAHGEKVEDVERYLYDQIRYGLGEAEIKGANHFFRLAADAGLLPECELRFAGGNADVAVAPSVQDLLAKAARGERLSVADAVRIDEEAPLLELGLAADERRRALHPGNVVTYIIERNLNYTNVCNVYCRFCAFYRPPNHQEGYVLSKAEIGAKIEEMLAAGGVQLLLQGGLNPDLGLDYYEDLFRWIRAHYPVWLHALSPDEIIHVSKLSGLSLFETLQRLHAAGLGSVPGAGAELLVDHVRRRIAQLKSPSEDWLAVMRTVHRLGMRSTCTMMFGVGESSADRVSHMLKLRDLQDQTGGFTAFICWPFQDEHTRLSRSDTSAHAYLRTQALARLFLDNIANIQASWVTMGPAIGQTALFFGANDFGQVMFEENVVSAAGTTFRMDEDGIRRHIAAAGFTPMRRNMQYDHLPMTVG